MSDPIQSLAQKLRDPLEAYGFVTGQGAGAAFPASPATGAPFFRTDLGLWAYHDGTRWLSAHEYSADMSSLDGVNPVAAAPFSHSGTPARGNYAQYITRAVARTFVVTTNNATNFWTISLYQENTAIWTFTTAGDGLNATLHTTTINTAYTPATYFRYRVDTKTLAPGALTLNGTFWYRLVLT